MSSRTRTWEVGGRKGRRGVEEKGREREERGGEGRGGREALIFMVHFPAAI